MKKFLKTVPFKELILSQVFSIVFLFVCWFILGQLFGREMGIIFTLHTVEQLPITLVYGLIFFYNIDILTPNPRKHTRILGVIISEIFEHLFLPLGIIIIILIIPGQWYFYIIIYTFITFGLILGKIKKFKDVIKVYLMSFIFTITLYIPDFLKVLLVKYELGFEITIPFFIVLPFIIYLLVKLFLSSRFPS